MKQKICNGQKNVNDREKFFSGNVFDETLNDVWRKPRKDDKFSNEKKRYLQKKIFDNKSKQQQQQLKRN